jgi:uncharacterized protein YqhQ
MMRGPSSYAIACRLAKTGEIKIDRGPLTSKIYTRPFWKLPLIRGLALMVETIHLGMKSMIWSANLNATGQDLEIGKREIAIAILVAAAAGSALFILIPLLGAGLTVKQSGSFVFVVVEGCIRVVLVLGYMALIGLLPDVRRVFQYHGAEHMTINAYESDWPLEVESVEKASLLHPRCGTGFLIVVVVVSVLLFSMVAAFHPNWLGLILSRIAGIPIIAGLSLEYIRLLGRHRGHPFARLLLVPVLATQKLTTRRPSPDMLEVAIAAFNCALEGGSV